MPGPRWVLSSSKLMMNLRAQLHPASNQHNYLLEIEGGKLALFLYL